MKYSMIVAWSEEDKMFVAICPELESLSALGPTQEVAVKELTVSINLALETSAEEGWLIPPIKTIQEYN